jgi:hypothetical protein
MAATVFVLGLHVIIYEMDIDCQESYRSLIANGCDLTQGWSNAGGPIASTASGITTFQELIDVVSRSNVHSRDAHISDCGLQALKTKMTEALVIFVARSLTWPRCVIAC